MTLIRTGKRRTPWWKIRRFRWPYFILIMCAGGVVLIINMTMIDLDLPSTPKTAQLSPLDSYRLNTDFRRIGSEGTNSEALSKPYVVVSKNGHTLKTYVTKLLHNPINEQSGEIINIGYIGEKKVNDYTYSKTEIGATTIVSTQNLLNGITEKSETSKLTARGTDTLRSKADLPPFCTDKFKSSHLLTTSPIGRAGNQLFELMALIASANDSCYTPFIKAENIYLDSIFDIQGIVRQNINMSEFGKIREYSWTYFHAPIVTEIMRANKDLNWTIAGYRQSFRYFQHKRQLVTTSFVFKDEIKMNVTNYLVRNSLNEKTKVGVHVRRGDFLVKKNTEYGYLASSIKYIHRAMGYFKRLLRDSNLIFIFVSDDIAWCKENMKADTVYFSPFTHPGSDLYLLTQCDHNILTGGSFGWMGAWLNETGHVVYDTSFPKYQSWLWKGFVKEHYYPNKWIGI